MKNWYLTSGSHADVLYRVSKLILQINFLLKSSRNHFLDFVYFNFKILI